MVDQTERDGFCHNAYCTECPIPRQNSSHNSDDAASKEKLNGHKSGHTQVASSIQRVLSDVPTANAFRGLGRNVVRLGRELDGDARNTHRRIAKSSRNIYRSANTENLRCVRHRVLSEMDLAVEGLLVPTPVAPWRAVVFGAHHGAADGNGRRGHPRRACPVRPAIPRLQSGGRHHCPAERRLTHPLLCHPLLPSVLRADMKAPGIDTLG